MQRFMQRRRSFLSAFCAFFAVLLFALAPAAAAGEGVNDVWRIISGTVSSSVSMSGSYIPGSAADVKIQLQHDIGDIYRIILNDDAGIASFVSFKFNSSDGPVEDFMAGGFGFSAVSAEEYVSTDAGGHTTYKFSGDLLEYTSNIEGLSVTRLTLQRVSSLSNPGAGDPGTGNPSTDNPGGSPSTNNPSGPGGGGGGGGCSAGLGLFGSAAAVFAFLICKKRK